jgi:tRNA threonylcarbamoyladenosine biosynthesis protein TsaB
MTMKQAILLALDSATDLASAALYDGERVLAEVSWHSARRHTVELLPQVDTLCALMGLTAADVSGIAVAVGPGSFTGIRVALSLAKGIASARQLPLLGVSTLDAIAHPHRGQPLPVTALVQAGRGRVCWAYYAPDADTVPWPTGTPAQISSVEAVAQATRCPTLFAGEVLPATRATLVTQLGSQAHFVSPALTLRRASYLAEIAWPRFLAGHRDDLASLAPIYLHELPPGPVHD